MSLYSKEYLTGIFLVLHSIFKAVAVVFAFFRKNTEGSCTSKSKQKRKLISEQIKNNTSSFSTRVFVFNFCARSNNDLKLLCNWLYKHNEDDLD